MYYETGNLAALTIAVNDGIDEVGAGIAQADGTLASLVTAINGLITFLGSSVPAATGTITNARTTWNRLVRGNRTVYLTERQVSGGTRVTTPSINIPNNIDAIHLSLTSSNWTTVGAGTVEWGVEASFDNGNTWELMGGATVAIGALNKGFLMPSISLSNLIALGGLWRAYAIASRTLRLGLEGKLG